MLNKESNLSLPVIISTKMQLNAIVSLFLLVAITTSDARIATSCHSDFACAPLGVCEHNTTVGFNTCMQKKQLLEQCDVKRQCTATNPSYDCRRDSKMGPFMYCHCNVTMKMHMATRECVDKNWCAKDQDCIDTSLVCAHQRCVLRTSIGSKTITVTTTQTRKTSATSHRGGGKTGLIIGIVVAIVVIGAVILFLVCKNRNSDNDVITGSYIASPGAGYVGSPVVGYPSPVIAPTVVVGPSFGYGGGYSGYGGYGHHSTEMVETTTTTVVQDNGSAGYAPAPTSYSNTEYYSSPSYDNQTYADTEFYSPCE